MEGGSKAQIVAQALKGAVLCVSGAHCGTRATLIGKGWLATVFLDGGEGDIDYVEKFETTDGRTCWGYHDLQTMFELGPLDILSDEERQHLNELIPKEVG